MRIFQILHKGNFNTGSVHQMFLLSRGLKERGHEVTIITRPGSELAKKAKEEKIPCHELPLRHQLDLPSLWGLYRLYQSYQPEVVHVHKGLDHTLALGASFFHPIPCFVANRGVSFPLTLWNRGKYRSRRCHRVVCVCEAIRQVVIQTGKVAPDKVKVIYAGTDTEVFDPKRFAREALRASFGFKQEEVVICQIGLRPWRGWKTLVEAFAIVQKQVKIPLRLLLVACKDKEQEEAIRRFAHTVGVSGGLTIWGYRKDMPEIAYAQDIAVDLSYEGLGITGTLREALAMERPVVASHAGGNAELVVEGRTGFLVPPKDPEATAKALKTLILQPELRNSFGKAGRKRVVESFSQAQRIQKMESLYQEVLKK